MEIIEGKMVIIVDTTKDKKMKSNSQDLKQFSSKILTQIGGRDNE